MHKMGDDSPGLRLRDFSKLIGQEHNIRSGVTNIEVERREEVPDQSCGIGKSKSREKSKSQKKLDKIGKIGFDFLLDFNGKNVKMP